MIVSVWIQMSRLTWPIKVQAKAKILNCFFSVTLKDVPREFPPVRRNPLGKNWENLCQFSGLQLAGGRNNVCTCARSHGSRWRQRPEYHTKLRKNGGVFRMVPSLWWKGRATLKTVERNLNNSSLDHWSAHTFFTLGFKACTFGENRA